MSPKGKSYTIKFLEENIGENLYYLCVGKYFSDTTLEVSSIKEHIDKLNFIKTKTFCYSKNSGKSLKTQVIDWEEIWKLNI